MIKFKNGEWYAKEILKKNYDLKFDESYSDDNSMPNMPDLRYLDGRYLEITETPHARHLKDYFYGSNSDYLELLSNNIKQQHQKLLKILKNVQVNLPENDEEIYEMLEDYLATINEKAIVSSMDQMHRTGKFINNFSYSIFDILEVIQRKSNKHQGKDIDLFIAVCKDEMDLIINKDIGSGYDLLPTIINNSEFKKIFLCELSPNEDNIFTFDGQRILCLDHDITEDSKIFYRNINKLNLDHATSIIFDSGEPQGIKFVFEDPIYDVLGEFLTKLDDPISFMGKINDVLKEFVSDVKDEIDGYCFKIGKTYTEIKKDEQTCIIGSEILLNIIRDWIGVLKGFKQKYKNN